VAQAQTKIPENYTINCWDGTFAYNRLKAETKNEKIAFKFSGQQLSVFRHILPPGDERHWGALEAELQFDRSACQILESDQKIIGCKSENANLTVSVRTFPNEQKFIVPIKAAFLQLRKIEEIGYWGKATSGYQVILQDMQKNNGLLISQHFYTGLGGMEDEYCGRAF
jgi:hypothetical protein